VLGLAVVTAACGGGASAGPADGGSPFTADTGAEAQDEASTPRDASSPVDGQAGADGHSPMDGDVPDGEPVAQDAAVDAAVLAVALTACPEGDYAAPVTIGGTQTFSLVVDTGSTTLGVASSQCTTCDGVTPVYTPGTGATDEQMTAKSQYVTGYWSGEIYQDSVAAVTAAPPVSTEVRLVSIDSQENFFQTIQCGQGVLGLARAKAAVAGTTGFFDQLVATGAVANVFGMELCPTGGTLWLGGYDPTATTGSPQYIPFAISPYASYYYVVKLTSITVLGDTVPVATAQYSDAIVDTGTNAFVVPTAAYASITATIAASPAFAEIFGADAGGFFSLQATADAGPIDASGDIDAGVMVGQACATLTQTKAELDSALPALTLTFGSNPGVSVQATATESYLAPAGKNVWCSALAAVDPSASFPFASIVGTPVLRSNVVIFDRAGDRLGFAPHAPCP
jgi:hypothetical protein